MSTKNVGGGNGDVILQVRQVKQALRTIYLDPGLVDDSDLEGMPANQQEPRLLSRALTAQAVRMVTGFSPREAALTVIDGVADS
ncbi:hypothetical protein [Streptomyces sporangiiformans]|uniref:Uncharacterized protein n=1 Tax=Streptomyces sporangiiformans TaxID=2315329 RepID=A0A505DMH8_9ACTN|nr:hypothetical protein [Streptomyces sporangiiformans]TPQ21609.1 hypothetical protein FGD71_014335 [Streptomyces sporangiiformans]